MSLIITIGILLPAVIFEMFRPNPNDLLSWVKISTCLWFAFSLVAVERIVKAIEKK